MDVSEQELSLCPLERRAYPLHVHNASGIQLVAGAAKKRLETEVLEQRC